VESFDAAHLGRLLQDWGERKRHILEVLGAGSAALDTTLSASGFGTSGAGGLARTRGAAGAGAAGGVGGGVAAAPVLGAMDSATARSAETVFDFVGAQIAMVCVLRAIPAGPHARSDWFFFFFFFQPATAFPLAKQLLEDARGCDDVVWIWTKGSRAPAAHATHLLSFRYGHQRKDDIVRCHRTLVTMIGLEGPEAETTAELRVRHWVGKIIRVAAHPCLPACLLARMLARHIL
jgi:hypothetical protein